MLKLFKGVNIWCFLVYMTLYWRSWQGCHFFGTTCRMTMIRGNKLSRLHIITHTSAISLHIWKLCCLMLGLAHNNVFYTMMVNITEWTNSVVELDSTLWITVIRWSQQPFTGVWGQRTRLCTAIVQKTAAIVVKNVGTSRTTDRPRHADKLVTIKGLRNWTDTREQQVFFFVIMQSQCVCCIPKQGSMVSKCLTFT